MSIILGTLLICYLWLFIYAYYKQDNSIVDVFWGPWFVIIALLSYFLFSAWWAAQMLITLLVTAWWVRLALNIGAKKIWHSSEDARYARWRKQWKYFYIRSFFQVYMFQGFLMCLVATPIFVMNMENSFDESILLTFVWGLIALWGLIYEARADAELAGFIVNKKSWDILTNGLRSFHRYPQYFGESLFWFGIALIASQISLWAFLWWWVITILVRYVSGVPLLEERYSWNTDFEKYSKRVPIFIPNFFLWKNSS